MTKGNGELRVVVSGGTGYLGCPLVESLIAANQPVRVLARAGSEHKVPEGAEIAVTDPFDPASIQSALECCGVFIHLLGTPKPAPWKGSEFRRIDQRSLKASVDAAKASGVGHFIYVSVAHPAPIMRAYIEVRTQCEEYIRQSRMNATILRPWYVLGPSHHWPRLLKPLYAAARRIPAWADAAARLDLVTLEQMICALRWAVANPSHWRIIDVAEIRTIAARY